MTQEETATQPRQHRRHRDPQQQPQQPAQPAHPALQQLGSPGAAPGSVLLPPGSWRFVPDPAPEEPAGWARCELPSPSVTKSGAVRRPCLKAAVSAHMHCVGPAVGRLHCVLGQPELLVLSRAPYEDQQPAPAHRHRTPEPARPGQAEAVWRGTRSLSPPVQRGHAPSSMSPQDRERRTASDNRPPYQPQGTSRPSYQPVQPLSVPLCIPWKLAASLEKCSPQLCEPVLQAVSDLHLPLCTQLAALCAGSAQRPALHSQERAWATQHHSLRSVIRRWQRASQNAQEARTTAAARQIVSLKRRAFQASTLRCLGLKSGQAAPNVCWSRAQAHSCACHYRVAVDSKSITDASCCQRSRVKLCSAALLQACGGWNGTRMHSCAWLLRNTMPADALQGLQCIQGPGVQCRVLAGLDAPVAAGAEQEREQTRLALMQLQNFQLRAGTTPQSLAVPWR